MRLRIKPTSGVLGILKWSGRAGFTFAEVLAALVFMAIVIPVAMQGIQIANRAGVVAQRKAIAVQLATSQLQELFAFANNTMPNFTQNGNFGPDWRDYR
jgi:type II secretory pathway pseudopilin PulG